MLTLAKSGPSYELRSAITPLTMGRSVLLLPSTFTSEPTAGFSAVPLRYVNVRRQRPPAEHGAQHRVAVRLSVALP